MALEFAHGAIQWLTGGTVGDDIVVSGLSFQPKALRFYWNGLQSGADAVSNTVEGRRGVGFGVAGPTQRAVGTWADNAAGTMACASIAINNGVVVTIDGAAAVTGRLSLVSLDSGGFTLNIDDLAVANLTVFWEAWGGADMTVASIFDVAEPATAVATNYTLTGFTAGATDQVIMLAGVQSTAALNTGLVESSTLSIGFAAQAGAANSICVMGSQDHGGTTSDSDGGCYTGMCIARVALAGGAVNDARAYLSAYGTDLFTLQWAERAITNRRTVGLAIKGGSWTSGSVTIEGQTLNATATVSGLPYAPKGLSLIGRMTAEQADDVTTVQDRIGLGSGSSTSSRRSMDYWDEDTPTTSDINFGLQYDQVMEFTSSAAALANALDINAMNADGFQLVVDTSPGGGVTTQWVGYLTFGDVILTPIPDVVMAPMRPAMSRI